MEPRSTILLIEDNPDDVLLFQRALRAGQQDYDVHVATSGQEAIDYLQRAGQGGDVQQFPVPKFIIMDNALPVITASEFLRWISAHPIYGVVPTVVLAGSNAPSDVKLAFELGVHSYFVKPTSSSKLEELMKMIFHYWAESSVPPVKEFRVTAPGEQPVLKTSGG
jgi:CheY-like chemotaxis protein